MFQVVEKPNVLTHSFTLVTTSTPSAWTASSSWMFWVFSYTSLIQKEYPPQTKNENIKTYKIFTAQNHTIYCNNKMLYFGGIQGKVWHPHYQKGILSLKNVTLVQKRWPVGKPSHSAVGIPFYFTAEVEIWIIYSNRFKLCWYFLVAWGTPATRHCSGLTAYQEAENTTLRQSFHNSHPGRFATNHKTSPLPQEDSEKATR